MTTEKAAAKAPRMVKVTLAKKLPRRLTVGGVEQEGGATIEVTEAQSKRLFEQGFLATT